MELIIIFLIMVGVCSVPLLLFNRNRKDIYVDIKTEIRYRILHEAKMWNSANGIWVESWVYYNIRTGRIYTMDKTEFLRKYISLKEYEKWKK